MKYRLSLDILIAVSLSIVTSKIVYFGFNSNYSTNIFTPQSFSFHFDHDVYKYRILSNYLLVAIDQWMMSNNPHDNDKRRIVAVTKQESKRFYYSLFYLNTIFLCLASVVWVLLLSMKQTLKLTDTEKHLLLFLGLLIINISQFALVPYDIPSYFFQLLIIYIFMLLSDKDYIFTIAVLCFLIAISTTNRESSAMSVSLLSLLVFQKMGVSLKSSLSVFLLILSFLIPYIALRYTISSLNEIHIPKPLAGDFSNELNIIGLVFWSLLFYLTIAISDGPENKRMIVLYHLLSLPYIIVCLKDGILWEVRLYMPLFLGALFLSKLNTQGFKIQLHTLSLKNLKSIFPQRKAKALTTSASLKTGDT